MTRFAGFPTRNEAHYAERHVAERVRQAPPGIQEVGVGIRRTQPVLRVLLQPRQLVVEIASHDQIAQKSEWLVHRGTAGLEGGVPPHSSSGKYARFSSSSRGRHVGITRSSIRRNRSLCPRSSKWIIS